MWCQLGGARATPDLWWLGIDQPGLVWSPELELSCLAQSPVGVLAKDLLAPSPELSPGSSVCIEVTLATPGPCPWEVRFVEEAPRL